jgi:hypothetical protein
MCRPTHLHMRYVKTKERCNFMAYKCVDLVSSAT